MQVRHDPAADTAAIMEADKQFDLDTAAKGIDGWLPWFEENVATWTRAGLVHGRDHYKDNVGKLLAGGNQLRWVPVYGEVTGDLGFTTGTWKILGKDAQGQEQKFGSGKYFTVWRRQ
ncbi:MAG: hypothetical protein JST92_00285, partial [Deltaproteobacteria bacterium]|nr:hypothetical protein [Deltaproteobacteria bacterium]